jgi:hypothetical protein
MSCRVSEPPVPMPSTSYWSANDGREPAWPTAYRTPRLSNTPFHGNHDSSLTR